jgi:hypothetical protein
VITAEPTRYVALSLLLLMGVSCAPSTKCGGELYYDAVMGTCRPCPSNARFAAGTCVCNDERVFTNHRCELRDGSMPAGDDDGGAGANGDAAPAADGCSSYCDFIHVCLGGNTLATNFLPEVISGLHADDPTACTQSCDRAESGSAPSPLATCVEAGRNAAMCAGDTTQTGLQNSIMLLAQCSRSNSSDPLRKLICDGLTKSAQVASNLDFCD